LQPIKSLCLAPHTQPFRFQHVNWIADEFFSYALLFDFVYKSYFDAFCIGYCLVYGMFEFHSFKFLCQRSVEL